MDEFISQIQNSVPGPESVFILGANYYWPWLAWIQHLYAAENNGRMPEDYEIETWNEAIEEWESLSSREGVFNEDYRELNFAGSALGIQDGDGLFVLSDSTIFQVYTPDERPGLGSIPFPGARSWEIGTGFYTSVLDLDTSGASLRAASAYRAYLHSREVREEMLAVSGIPLLPLSRDSDRPAKREIPSITQNVRDIEIQDLLKYLDK